MIKQGKRKQREYIKNDKDKSKQDNLTNRGRQDINTQQQQNHRTNRRATDEGGTGDVNW